MSYILIAATIALTVAGQLLVKAGMLEVGPLPASLSDIWSFVLHVLTNLKVVAGLGLAVVAALCWTGAVSTSEISFAYPFMALAIVLVLALSGVLLGEVVPNRPLGGRGYCVHRIDSGSPSLACECRCAHRVRDYIPATTNTIAGSLVAKPRSPEVTAACSSDRLPRPLPLSATSCERNRLYWYNGRACTIQRR